MSQLIYCLAAIVILALYGLNRHQTQAAGERTLISREVESGALQVAERWAARIKDRAFDEADVAAAEPRIDDLTGLTDPAFLGVSTADEVLSEAPAHGTDFARFDDVDDFAEVSGIDTLWVGAERATPLLFQVDIDVRYVNAATLAPSAGTTLAKEAVVQVVGPLIDGRPAARVRVPVHTTAARQFLHN
ncbi:MAG: hypothetical protein AAF845_14170 [Bacteroidota bacterium]